MMISMTKMSLLGLSLAIILGSCGGSDTENNINPQGGTAGSVTVEGKPFKVLPTLIQKDPGVSGSGSFVAVDQRQSGDNNYTLVFSLEKNGSLTLVTNADVDLKTGANLKFSRATDSRISVALKVGDETLNLSEEFQEVSAGGEITLSIDVHEHGHVMIWVGSATEPKEYAFVTRVSEKFWGIRMENSDLKTARADKSKVEHSRADKSKVEH